MVAAKTIRGPRLSVRLDLRQKKFIKSAAAHQGRTLSEFVVTSSVEAAQVVLAQQKSFSLSEENMSAFLAQLEAPPKVLPQLRELFNRKSCLAD